MVSGFSKRSCFKNPNGQQNRISHSSNHLNSLIVSFTNLRKPFSKSLIDDGVRANVKNNRGGDGEGGRGGEKCNI